MALSRGGDRVVIRDGENSSSSGGRSETERRTKVKSRVVASAFSELLASTDQVIVMGHKYPDLDVLGAVAGVCATPEKRVPFRAGPGPSPTPAEEQTRQLAALPEHQGILCLRMRRFTWPVVPTTISVVVDTNRPEQTQVPELLDSGARIVVIDHHRRAASYIEKPPSLPRSLRLPPPVSWWRSWSNTSWTPAT